MKLAELSIADVYPSVSNTRVDYNGADMAELVKSIEAVGLLNPILVRKAADMGYEIIAGHRRYHALKKIGRQTVAVQIVDATLEDAARLRLIENIQRKDLNAIEEAEAFAQLRDQHQMGIEQIVERVDKPLSYVARAFALLALPKKATEAIRAGTLPAAHGHQIFRAPEKERDRLTAFALAVDSWTKTIPTLSALKREIEKRIEKNLKLAPFPKDVAHYGGDEMGACVSCPFNTGNQGALFDGAVDGKCTNPGCFNKRTNAAYRGFANEIIIKWSLVYLGAKQARYNSDREFMGFPIVRHTDAKNKKMITEHPENFAFGIWKVDPQGYGRKKPEMVIVCTKVSEHAKLEKAAREPDYQRERYIEQRWKLVLVEWANKKVKAIEKKHLIQMLNVDDQERANLKKKSFEEILKSMWLGWVGEWEVEEKLLDAGLDAKQMKQLKQIAINEATKMWDNDQKTKEKPNE